LPADAAAWIVGIVGLGVGAYLVLSSPSHAQSPVSIGLAPIPGGALMSARGRLGF
jgi:hypothetical protein